MERNIKSVQVDGLVLMKIIKHCQDELVQNQDFVNGVLLGLSTNDVLEITHCFPIPKTPEEMENSDPNAVNFLISSYQTQMIKNLRSVNVDYMVLGLYQNSYSGSFLNRITLENLYSYHKDVNESIMLVYDPAKTTQGHISLRAFQLTKDMKNIIAQSCSDDDSKVGDFDYDMKYTTVNISDIFREIPVVIRNSHLVNSIVGAIEDKLPKATEKSFAALDLSVGSSMENQLKALMDSLELMSLQMQQHLQYLKMSNRKDNMKPNQALPNRLDTSLQLAEIIQYSQDLSELSGQTIGKLMLARAVHDAAPEEQ